MASQVVTVNFKENPGSSLINIIINWTSATGGTVSQELMAEYIDWRGLSDQRLSGYIEDMVTIPDSSDAPTDNYDITLMAVYRGDTEENSFDILGGAGNNRDTANVESCRPFIGGLPAAKMFAELSTLTFTIANAGDEKKGTAIISIARA